MNMLNLEKALLVEEAFSLSPIHANWKLEVIEGKAWLTLGNGGEDHVIQAGENAVIPKQALAVIGPLGKASLVVRLSSVAAESNGVAQSLFQADKGDFATTLSKSQPALSGGDGRTRTSDLTLIRRAL